MVSLDYRTRTGAGIGPVDARALVDSELPALIAYETVSRAPGRV